MIQNEARTTAAPVMNGRDFDVSMLPEGRLSPLATELETYRDRLDEILGHGSETPYVAILGHEILGYYRTSRTAIDESMRRHGPTPVLIMKIVETEHARSLGGGSI